MSWWSYQTMQPTGAAPNDTKLVFLPIFADEGQKNPTCYVPCEVPRDTDMRPMKVLEAKDVADVELNP